MMLPDFFFPWTHEIASFAVLHWSTCHIFLLLVLEIFKKSFSPGFLAGNCVLYKNAYIRWRRRDIYIKSCFLGLSLQFSSQIAAAAVPIVANFSCSPFLQVHDVALSLSLSHPFSVSLFVFPCRVILTLDPGRIPRSGTRANQCKINIG